jgi:hypothetical protein
MQGGIMKRSITAVVAVAAIAAPVTAVMTASASAAPQATRTTYAWDWWRGPHEASAPQREVRPSVLGSSFGEPITSLHWSTWTGTQATGKGEIVHMSCQPCHITVRLTAPRVTNGTRYFYTLTEGWPGFSYVLHWRDRDWLGG